MDDADEDRDYVTVMRTRDPYKFLAAIIRYHRETDDYWPSKCSNLLKEEAAQALARSWAAALGLEVRM